MREIKCRGFNTGEWGWKPEPGWVHGYFVMYYDGQYQYTKQATPVIFFVEDGAQKRAPVILESVGQFTGLKDGNGIEIFEGDLLIPAWSTDDTIPPIIVEFRDGKFGIGAGYFFQSLNQPAAWKITGNIYEYPHLLETEAAAARGD